MNNFEIVIGVEVHAELNTKHKIFSPAINDINAPANTNVHPTDLGMPGALPSFNNEVLKKALKITKALKMDITKEMHWDRKNYFYHDNPKGYQITQFDTPIGRNGKIVLDNKKEVIVDFMHMEEDTAKTFNEGEYILLDYNRCGVPLVEIVTKPCLRSADETKEYLEKLREILVFLDVSDGKMNEGSFRVDVNVSIRPLGYEGLNPKVEIKNLNSFSNVVKAIELESKIQIKEYILGNKVLEATKRFDEDSKSLVVMRVKENAADYRYFPEPDLPWIELNDEFIKKYTSDMPLLPNQIRKLLVEENSLDEKEVEVLLMNKQMVDFYLETLKEESLKPKQTLNYLLVNVNEYLNKEKVEFIDTYLSIDNLVDIEELLTSGKISSNHVKKIIPNLLKESKNVKELVKELGIEQISDPKIIESFVKEVLDENPESIELYKSGKNKAFGFLIGKIIAKSKGQANPKLVNEILKENLDNE